MRPSRSLLVCAAFVLTIAAMPLPAQEPPAPVIDLTPEERRAYNEGLAEARSLIAEGQWTRAAARLERLVRQRPRESQARFLKGVVEAREGNADAAIATFRALVDDYPELPEPYNNLAVLYAQRGEIEAARAALETAIRTAPDWATAHENLGDVYARLALEQYDRAAALDKASRTAPAKLKLARDLLAAGAAKP